MTRLRRSWLPVPLQLEEVSCALCAGTSSRRLLSHDSFGFPIGQRLCTECGFVFTSPRPTETYIDRFYKERYRRFYEGTDHLDESYIVKRRWRDLADLRLRRYERWLRRDMRIFDIGCGAGLFLAHAREQLGASVRGIEPDPVLGSYARDHLALDITNETFKDVSVEPTYDVVAAFHVVEHVHDLERFFATARGMLSDDGRLIIETPNLDGSWSGIGFFHVAHLYAFTIATLELIARRYGFELEYAAASEHDLDPSNLHAVFRPLDAPAPQVLARPPSDATLTKLDALRSLRFLRIGRWMAKSCLRAVGLR
jgi:2-polyprenyl-3-methyl-5-hydroxy-6-metoxy-1,4-benzoquinol methylase